MVLVGGEVGVPHHQPPRGAVDVDIALQAVHPNENSNKELAMTIFYQ